jgi:hypothetical protein
MLRYLKLSGDKLQGKPGYIKLRLHVIDNLTRQDKITLSSFLVGFTGNFNAETQCKLGNFGKSNKGCENQSSYGAVISNNYLRVYQVSCLFETRPV